MEEDAAEHADDLIKESDEAIADWSQGPEQIELEETEENQEERGEGEQAPDTSGEVIELLVKTNACISMLAMKVLGRGYADFVKRSGVWEARVDETPEMVISRLAELLHSQASLLVAKVSK